MKRERIVIVAICILLAGRAASAQEKGQAGIVMGIPSSVAIIWHPTENVALRPEVSFIRTSTDNEGSSFASESRSWNVGFGVSGLFYFHKSENLHPYFSPRFSYARLSATSESSGVTVSTSKGTANTYSTSGSIGAQYAISRRFGAFGETGILYSRQSQRNNGVSSGKANVFSTRSSAGVIVYFD